jgi:branched-chain amino acid transport system permease protein
VINASQLLAQGVTFGSVYALMALGYHLIYVSTGILNFALGEQLVISALIVLSLVALGLPLWPAVAVAVLIGAGIGALYERLVFRPAERLGHIGPIIGSIGVLLVIYYGRNLVWDPEPRAFPPFSGLPNQAVDFLGGRWLVQSFWVLGVTAALLLAITLFFQRTRYGRAWRAVAHSQLGARLCGVNPALVSAGAVALASALVTVGGIVIAPITLAGGFFGLAFAVKGFAAAVIGGFDSTPGVVAGGLIVGLIESFAIGFASAEVANIVLYSLLVATLLVRPVGLFGTRAAVKV